MDVHHQAYVKIPLDSHPCSCALNANVGGQILSLVHDTYRNQSLWLEFIDDVMHVALQEYLRLAALVVNLWTAQGRLHQGEHVGRSLHKLNFRDVAVKLTGELHVQPSKSS